VSCIEVEVKVAEYSDIWQGLNVVFAGQIPWLAKASRGERWLVGVRQGRMAVEE
jgi:hypothetical protein